MCLPIYCDSLVRARAAEIDGARRRACGSTLACVRRALEALAPVRGRKSLLLLSEGFLEDFGSDSRAVAAASREANTAVYFVDVRGLVALPAYGTAADVGPPRTSASAPPWPSRRPSSSPPGPRASPTTPAASPSATRTTSRRAPGASPPSRASSTSSASTLRRARPREWRKLRVEVKRPGLTVRARRGYTLGSEMAGARQRKPGEPDPGPAGDPAVARALDSAHEETGIPLRAIAYMQEPRPGDVVHVLVAAELDATAVAPGPDGTARLEVSAQVAMRDSGRVFRQDAAVTIAAAAGEGPAWRAFTREFELPPGVAQVRLVVRDLASGAIGSVLQRLEVPSPASCGSRPRS